MQVQNLFKKTRKKQCYSFRIQRTIKIILLVYFWIVMITPNAWGQLPQANILDSLFKPKGDFGIVQRTVRLDGEELFQIAAPNVTDDTKQNPAINRRVNKIENRILSVVNTNFDVDTLQVFYSLKNNQPVIYASWKSRERPYEIMTVTALDAEIDGLEPQTRASELVTIILDAIKKGKLERRTPFLKRQFSLALISILITSAATTFISFQQRRLQKKWRILSENPPTQPLDNSSLEEPQPLPDPTHIQDFLSYKKQLDLNIFQRRFLQVVQIVIWYSAIFIVLGLFPQTRRLQLIIEAINSLFVVSIIIYAANRVTNLFIDQFITALEEASFVKLEPDLSRRQALRGYTLTRAFKNITSVAWFVIWLILILATLKVNLASILAAGGLISLALSVIFNDLIKDLITGVFILVDDQFAVGDVIAVGQVSGKVETMNLRMTQLRNSKGNLITLPNRTITTVENFSNGWSQVDLSIDVSYYTDIDQAIQVIKEVAEELKNDANWGSYILEPAEVLGVENMNHAGVTIRVFIKTKPLEQWTIAREYRRRLKIAFEEQGISIGVPQQSIQVPNSLDFPSKSPNNPDSLNSNPNVNS